MSNTDKYPLVEDLRLRARKRVPHFVWEYLCAGAGLEDGLERNRTAFNKITFLPEFLKSDLKPNLSTNLFGTQFSVPFGMSPVGLTGLMWPRTECWVADAAAKHNFPFTLGTVGSESPETIGPLCKGKGWFQLYPPRNKELLLDLLNRIRNSGFTTLVITCDVPVSSRRERQRRAGLRVPPRLTPSIIYQCVKRPAWSLATLRYGQPRFKTLEKYLSTEDMRNVSLFISKELSGLDWDYLEFVRQNWQGPIVLKGILDPIQASKAVDIGIDGIQVSNHGARQSDGVPAALEMLPKIRSAVGDEAKVLFDSGVRTGLDIARALALGADFVLIGRPFIYATVALGASGPDHLYDLLKSDLENNMAQLGCKTVGELSDRLNR